MEQEPQRYAWQIQEGGVYLPVKADDGTWVRYTDYEAVARERDEARKALADLVAKMDEVHASPQFHSVNVLAYLHGARYAGPNYADEFARAKAMLAAPPSPTRQL